jgi:hypothetical protein
VPQIMAILGHLTMKQAMHYVAQANRTKLADDAMAILERADAVADADNVVALHAPAKKRERMRTKLPKATAKNAVK